MFLTVFNQCDDCAETGTSVFHSFHICKQLCHICLRVMTFAGITGRIDSRLAAESLNFEAGVISKTVVTVMFLDPSGFLQGITLKSVGCLGYILLTACLSKAKYLKRKI